MQTEVSDLSVLICWDLMYAFLAGYCHGVQCSGTQVCIADKSGNSYCIDTRCPTVCPRSKYPVCGTDRKTYGTECALKKASCVSGRKINLAYLGLCQSKLSFASPFFGAL